MGGGREPDCRLYDAVSMHLHGHTCGAVQRRREKEVDRSFRPHMTGVVGRDGIWAVPMPRGIQDCPILKPSLEQRGLHRLTTTRRRRSMAATAVLQTAYVTSCGPNGRRDRRVSDSSMFGSIGGVRACLSVILTGRSRETAISIPRFSGHAVFESRYQDVQLKIPGIQRI